MLIGVPKEIKTNENRIALVPPGPRRWCRPATRCMVERGGGAGQRLCGRRSTRRWARTLHDVEEVWARAEMIMKVKEPIAVEYPAHPREPAALHLLPLRRGRDAHPRASSTAGAVCIAYETVQLPSGELPLLTPMSEVAGRMAIQAGAKYLEKFYGGRGMLLGGVPGVAPADVVIIGGGVVGTNAAKMAAGLGARVTILDLSLERLRYLSDVMPANVEMIYSNRHNLLERAGAGGPGGGRGAPARAPRRPSWSSART